MILDTLLSWTRTRKADTEAFTYSALFNPLVANAQQTVQINIHADSDFLIELTTLSAYSAAGVILPTPDMLLSLFDAGSGRALQDIPMHIANCTGTGQWPYRWPEPKMIKGAGNLSVILQDLGGVGARVDVSFHGQKIFYLSGYNRRTV
jgi:hypothetical protein